MTLLAYFLLNGFYAEIDYAMLSVRQNLVKHNLQNPFSRAGNLFRRLQVELKLNNNFFPEVGQTVTQMGAFAKAVLMRWEVNLEN